MPSSISTKMPKSAMLRTRPVTTVPGGYFSLSEANGFGSSCFMPRLMRFCVGSMSSTTASTVSPMASIFDGCLTLRVHDISEHHGARRVLLLGVGPRVFHHLLEAQGHALGLGVELQHLHADVVAD